MAEICGMLMEGTKFATSLVILAAVWAPRPGEEEKNSELALKSGRFAQLRGHWANQGCSSTLLCVFA
jgi:hypothetical protein